MKKSYYQRFIEMSDAQRDAEVARYDARELSLGEIKRLTRADRQRLDRAAHRRGRPKVGQGAKRVLVSIEGGVLSQADAAARRLGISRSEMVTRGLRAVMAAVA